MCDFQMPGVNTNTGGSPPTLLEVEVQPWFMDHVKTSLVKADFSSLYFTVGIVEEAAELLEEKQGGKEDSVVSEVGDLCWYIYGLCNSLPDLSPAVSSVSPPDPDTPEAAQVLFLCGKLAGSVKKWNRGDQSWDNFRPRIQKNVSDLLGLLSQLSPVPLEVAMKKNIEKILSRRERKVVLGDGSER